MNERDLIVITAAILLSGDRGLSISTAILLAEELISLVEERQKSLGVKE